MQLPRGYLKPTRGGALLLLLLCLIYATAAEELLELSCDKDQHCEKFEQPGETRVRCEDSRCICLAQDSGQRVNCRPQEFKLSNIIGGPCPCSQPHAECLTVQDKEQCYCSVGFTPSEDRRRCLPRQVPLDAACETDLQCQLTDNFALCHAAQHRCICQDKFKQHLGNCLAVLATSCSNDSDCVSSGPAVCHPQLTKCVCAPGYVHDRPYTKCVTGTAYAAECDHSASCKLMLGAGGACPNNHCSCRAMHYAAIAPNKTLNNERSIICQPVVVFGSYCRSDNDCQQQPVVKVPQTMMCVRGECHCKEHHHTMDSVICVAGDGVAALRTNCCALLGMLLLLMANVLVN